MYMNPVLNAPLGPDGLPVPVDPHKVQEFFEASPDQSGRRTAAAAPGPARFTPPAPLRLNSRAAHSLRAQDFYEDLFEELAKFGQVEYLNVCDNLADHMVGNCYVKFK
jgi:splicing factor U2AF subunit